MSRCVLCFCCLLPLTCPWVVYWINGSLQRQWERFIVKHWRPGSPSLLQPGLRLGPRHEGFGPLPTAPARAPGGGARRHHWPTARGRVENFSNFEGAGPVDLNANYWWSFHHPDGWFHSVCVGVIIDDASCLYLTCDDAIRKFSPDGQILWAYAPEMPFPRPPHLAGLSNIGTIPSLMDGALFGSTHLGYVFALNIDTGKELWSVKVSDLPDHLNRTLTGDDNNFVGSYDGMVVTMKNRCLMEPPCMPHGGSMRMIALNATNGASLWEFQPDAPFWNFYPLFVGDGTMAFQDLEGRAYRIRLSDGARLWAAGGVPGSWCDGTAMLGPNGLVYAVSNVGLLQPSFLTETTVPMPGVLTAHRLEDGAVVWTVQMEKALNSWPVLARLPGRERLVVAMPMALQGPFVGRIAILDAETGERLTQWDSFRSYFVPGGDAAGAETRNALGMRPGCGPNSWSAPTVDAMGAIYVGYQDNRLYRLHDANANGHFEPSEVDTFDEGAFASGAAGAAFAPGLMAHCSCDGLFVFKT